MADDTEQEQSGIAPQAEGSRAGKSGGAEAAETGAEQDPQEVLLRDNPIVDKLHRQFGEAIEVFYCALERLDELTALVKRHSLVDIARFCHDDPDLYFNMLSDLCGVDYPDEDERFSVIYQLYSTRHNHRLRLKVKTSDGVPVPSVTSVWRTANWHEREAYDMYGIEFEGHPNLRRILMPDNWDGYPLRKEYPPEGKGMRERV